MAISVSRPDGRVIFTAIVTNFVRTGDTQFVPGIDEDTARIIQVHPVWIIHVAAGDVAIEAHRMEKTRVATIFAT
jgi:hypothetical protein